MHQAGRLARSFQRSMSSSPPTNKDTERIIALSGKEFLRHQERVLREILENNNVSLSQQREERTAISEEGDRTNASAAIIEESQDNQRKMTNSRNCRTALRQISTGEYLICYDGEGGCEEEIPRKRLISSPCSTLCLHCQHQKEKGFPY